MFGTFVSALPFANDNVAGVAVAVKAGRGQLFLLKLRNTTAAVAYLQMFNKLLAGITLGTTVPDLFVSLAANESVSIPMLVPYGFDTGLVIAGTTGAANNTAAQISVMALYE